LTGLVGMVPEENLERVTRSKFVTWLLGTSLGATALAALYPVLRFVMPPEVAEAPVNRVLAGKLSELPPNAGKIFRFGARPGLLVRTAGGEVRA